MVYDVVEINLENNTFKYVDYENHEKVIREDEIFLKGLYSPNFACATYLNIFKGNSWSCGNEYLKEKMGLLGYEENEETKIRLSDILHPELKWGNAQIKRYMKKTYLEKDFGIKLTKEDLVDFDLLAGFYSGHKYSVGYSGIFHTSKVLMKYEKELEKKWGEDWDKIKLPLLVL